MTDQAPPPPPPAPEPDRPGLLGRFVRGRLEDPAWVRPALLGVLAAAAALSTWALDVNGYGNTYYASAALAGSQSWEAWFYGAVDSAGFITVDKPPLSIWVTSLSVRVFGLSSWSVLLPQAAAGVATVFILFRTVRRWHGPAAAVGAAAAVTLTPVAVVIFRYNNPDAVLTLLLVGALALGYGAVRSGSIWQLTGAFALVGLGFLTKTTQALLVVPAIAIAYAAAAPGRLRRRLGHLAVAAGVMAAVAGSWIAVVELVPADSRPYIGGTTGNSFLEYVFGYNGLGRIFGQEGPAGDADPFGGGAGWTRLFNDEVGGQVSWLMIPAATGLLAGLWRTRRGRRTDGTRAGYLLWGTALVVHAAAFSFAHGVFHPYYTVTMAPALAALAGAGAVELWQLHRAGTTWPAAATVAATGWWAAAILRRTPDFVPWLGTTVLLTSILCAVGLVVAAESGLGRHRSAAVIAGIGLIAGLAGPVAYSLDTLTTSFSGGDPKAGPAAELPPAAIGAAPGNPGALPALPGSPGNDAAGDRLPPPGDRLPPPGDRPYGIPPGGPRPGRPDRPDGPAADRPLDRPGPGPGGVPAAEDALLDYLVEHRGDATWLAAAPNAHISAPMMLATGEPVMTMGGFGGGDPVPTVTELADHVAAGEVRFVIVTTGHDRNPGAGTLRTRWLEESCRVVEPADYGGGAAALTLYDCAP